MIKWTDEYVIGVELIDDQHKKLFEIAGRAYELLKNDFLDDKYDRIITIINELKDYAVFHFETEEKYMIEIGYRKFLSQKAEHNGFIEKVNGIDFEKLDENQEDYLLSIIEFAMDWVGSHILKSDKLITASN